MQKLYLMLRWFYHRAQFFLVIHPLRIEWRPKFVWICWCRVDHSIMRCSTEIGFSCRFTYVFYVVTGTEAWNLDGQRYRN